MDLLAPSPIIDAAVAILADGKTRTADEILDEGRKRGLFDVSMTRKHVYTSLSQYIERAIGAGRKPELSEDAEHRFRINRAPDDWPDIDTTGLPALTAKPQLTADTVAVIDRAKRAESGTDPTEYEEAVCALFSSLGFASTHVGGLGAPDGYADALLGPLAYRVMIECKLVTPDGIAHSSAPAEAAKYKDAYRGTYCSLVAPALAGEVTFVTELKTHGVSAWTTSDLIQLIECGAGAYDLRTLFETPGIAADQIEDLLWAQTHGLSKRLRVITSLILEHMATEQRLAQSLTPADAPRFTVDVAMEAVDTLLASRESSIGCARSDVEAAFEWLTNPLVKKAVWVDEARTSIVRV